MIDLKDCKHGYFYDGLGAYIAVGLFNKRTNSFTGISDDHHGLYLAEERHQQLESDIIAFTPLTEIPIYFNENSRPFDGRYDDYLMSKLKEISRWELSVDDKINLMEYNILNSPSDFTCDDINIQISQYSNEQIIKIIAMARLKLEGKF